MQALSSLFRLSWKLLKAIESFRTSWVVSSRVLFYNFFFFLSFIKILFFSPTVFTSITYSLGVKHCCSLLLSTLSGEGWAFSFSIKLLSLMPLVLMFIVQLPLKPGILVPFSGFLLQSAQHFVAGVTVLHLLGSTDLLGWKWAKKSLVLKYAPRQNLLDPESFELFLSLLGKSRHFSMQRCVFIPTASWSVWERMLTGRAAPPSPVIWACFPLALHFLAQIALFLATPWWVTHR